MFVPLDLARLNTIKLHFINKHILFSNAELSEIKYTQNDCVPRYNT